MANKFIIAFLGLLCLVPTYAAPATAQDSSEEISVKGIAARLKLLAITLEEFTELYTEVIEKGPKVFTDVLKDPNVLEVKTAAMESQTKLLKDYVDKIKAQNDDKKEHIFELAEEYSDIVNKFDSDETELTTEAAIIEKSLTANGLEDIVKVIQERFEAFLKKFSAEVDQYIKGLNENEKKDEKAFIDWYEKLQAEKDINKKVEMFENFYEDEDDDEAVESTE